MAKPRARKKARLNAEEPARDEAGPSQAVATQDGAQNDTEMADREGVEPAINDLIGDAAPDRREDAADRARRRAAHFAYFAGSDSENEEKANAHVGGSSARKLGPWSTAMDLVEARAAAVEARNNRLSLKTLDLSSDGIEWKPLRDSELGVRPRQTIDTLFMSCVELLVDNIDDVDSLWGIPDVIKIQLAKALGVQRKLSARVVALMTEGNPSEIVLPDCTQLQEEEFLTSIAPAMTPSLERLDLNLCGRGCTDKVVKALLNKGTLPSLKSLALGGAYRLSDEGLLELLKASPNLVELHLPQCSRIAGHALEELPSLTPDLRTLNLADCRGLSSTALRKILCDSESKTLKNLEALSLDFIAELDDQLLTDICVSLPQLARLSIRLCASITDQGVKGVAAGCGPRLTELRLDEVTKITDEALLAVSNSCPRLQVVTLKRCGKVTDAGIVCLVSCGQIRMLAIDQISQITNIAVKALVGTCSEKLEEANFSWCRLITNNALGLLADSCPELRKLTLFGCTQIGKEFLHGHSNEKLEIIGAPAQTVPPAEKLKLTLSYVEEPEE